MMRIEANSYACNGERGLERTYAILTNHAVLLITMANSIAKIATALMKKTILRSQWCYTVIFN